MGKEKVYAELFWKWNYSKVADQGEDTTFGKIIELVEEAQDSKSEAERFIINSKYYTPAV